MQDTRSIRLSQEDWNALLLVAVQNGYPNRTEYIRATLKGDKLWSSKQPPAEIEHTAPLLVKYPDLETQHLLDAANIEIETYKAKLAQLQAQLQNTKPLPDTAPVEENPHSAKKPVHRFPFASVLKHWPEARRNRYKQLPSMPTEWVNFTLETVYDMLDELE